MTDEKLQETLQLMKRDASTSNSLNMAVAASGKALELYEFMMCNYANINIKGVSKLQESTEYQELVKSTLLKYMGTSLVSTVEPEQRLMYLIISNSIMCHQVNSLNDNIEKVQSIEKQESQPVAISEEDQMMKNLMVRNLNNEYSDL